MKRKFPLKDKTPNVVITKLISTYRKYRNEQRRAKFGLHALRCLILSNSIRKTSLRQTLKCWILHDSVAMYLGKTLQSPSPELVKSRKDVNNVRFLHDTYD